MTHDPLQNAACKSVPLSVFFPAIEPNARRPRRTDFTTAKKVCATCPPDTRAACLEAAIADEDWHGFRAGLEPNELRAFAARRAHAYSQS